VGGVAKVPVMEIDYYEACEHSQKKQNRAMASQVEIDGRSHENPPFLLKQCVPLFPALFALSSITRQFVPRAMTVKRAF
jgi:hypothetical protein